MITLNTNKTKLEKVSRIQSEIDRLIYGTAVVEREMKEIYGKEHDSNPNRSILENLKNLLELNEERIKKIGVRD